jgi:glycosyltransferase involved in cell wall biosynthesis
VAQARTVSGPPDPEVLIVSDAGEVGGAETYLAALLAGVADSFTVGVVLGDCAPTELQQSMRIAGAGTTVVPGLARTPSVAAIVRLARLISARRPGLVHANLSDQGDGLTAITAARLAGVPVTATLHLVLPERRASLERLSGLALRRAAAVVGVSDSIGAYLAELGVAARVIHNGVSVPQLHPDARVRLGLGADDLVVGGIGRLDTQKGWDVLCAAARRIAEKQARLQVVVARGAGPARAPGAGAAAGAPVRFVGYHKHAARFLGAFDVLAVPSRYEGFGLVAAEAMLAGVPVVASRIGGLPEVVGPDGVLVEPGDPDALAEALLMLLKDPKWRAQLGNQGAARAGQWFGSERMARETGAVWHSVVPPTPGTDLRCAS